MAIFTAAEALEMAMEIEKNGEVFYNAVAAKSTAKIKALFEDLALQERKHYAVFRKMAGNVTDETPSLPAGEYDEYQVYLQATLNTALFGPDKALAAAKLVTDPQAALRAALGFEKDTLLFFYDLREMVSQADHKALDEIIHEEKTHLRRLASMM